MTNDQLIEILQDHIARTYVKDFNFGDSVYKIVQQQPKILQIKYLNGATLCIEVSKISYNCMYIVYTPAPRVDYRPLNSFGEPILIDLKFVKCAYILEGFERKEIYTLW